MAKVAFSKLKCKINDTEVPVQIGEETVMVKQYLPIEKKLQLIGRIIELAHEIDFSYINPAKANVFIELLLLMEYSNISFTTKQQEKMADLYDSLKSSGVLNQIIEAIPVEEVSFINNMAHDAYMAFERYEQSVAGVIDSIKENYDITKSDLINLQEGIVDPNALTLLKDVLTKMN